MTKLVIGGCTITSCIRVSSTSIAYKFSSYGLDVVVDLSLCGARSDNYEKNADQNQTLVKIYGKDKCKNKSPVELAI